MQLRFSKMHGAGNDFVVLDGTRAPLNLTRQQLLHLGDRRLGVGADQILLVEPSPEPGIDFAYRIFNGATGHEVEHCGNGARCFLRFVQEQGLTQKTQLRVRTVNRVLALAQHSDGRVTVNMGEPVFTLADIVFNGQGLVARAEGGFELWPLTDLAVPGADAQPTPAVVELAVLSMGNPHAVLRVADVETAPVASWGPAIEHHARFAHAVNVGFMQVLSRQAVRLRVFERGAGETLSCGTGACAAVVAGVRLGWLDAQVEVHTRGGDLRIEWAGLGSPVLMSGPAQTVYEGTIEL
jgi:diaminopimelate epimerase